METKPSPRSLMVANLRAARFLVKVGNTQMIRKGNRMIVEYRNQLRLMDAIEYGLIQRVKGG